MQSSLTHIPTGKWEFDEQVTDAFDDMLKRSIPQYDVMRSSVVNIAKNYAMQGASMIDLGCSKGEILQLLINEIGGYCKYIGVDISSAMLSSCRERFSHYPSELISIEECDLRTGYPKINNACVVISSLTLQFTPIEYRQQIVKKVYDSMLPGSVFILVEKILGKSYEVNNLMVKLYYELKGENGYNQESIERKRLSLEGVLVPVTAGWNEDILHSAGFLHIDCFWRWMNFAGWMAIK